MALRFDWDETKDAINLRKHGIGFEAASLVFDDPMHLSVQDREVDGEQRWQTIGMAEGVLLLLVAHTVEDEDDEEVVRILSARRATAQERSRYEDD
ncbi:MAG: BrnT family toxin [Acidobacteria bacterium]|nr:BrnT family toxin [Acidobacteriota bacterium]